MLKKREFTPESGNVDTYDISVYLEQWCGRIIMFLGVTYIYFKSRYIYDWRSATFLTFSFSKILVTKKDKRKKLMQFSTEN